MGNKIHIDSKLIDKGWKDMNLLLDEEMPVVNSSGGRMGFWVALVAFFLLGIVAVWGLKVVKPGEESHFSKEQPMHLKSPSERPMADNENTIEQKQTLVEADIQNAKPNENRIPAPERKNRAGSQHPAFIADISENESINSSSSLAHKSLSIISLNSSQSVDPQSLSFIHNQETVDESPVYDIRKSSLPVLNRELALLPTPNVEVEVNDVRLLAMNYDKKMVKKILRKDKHTWGIRVGGHVEELGGSDGWSIGSFKDFYVFRNKRFSLSTGLAFSMRRKTKTTPVFNVKSLEDTTGDLSFSSMAGDTNFVQSMEFRENVTNTYMYYFDFPVSLKCHLGKRFYVSSGLSFSFLKNILFVVDSSEISDPYNNRLHDVISLDEFNKVDIAVNANIGYYLTNHFDISFKYEQGLFDFYESNKIGDYHKKLNLSMAYYF